jgi:hypothetical protein
MIVFMTADHAGAQDPIAQDQELADRSELLRDGCALRIRSTVRFHEIKN